jgi:hypothetical protein
MTDTIEPVDLDEDEKQQIAQRLVDQAREQVSICSVQVEC